MIIEEIKEKYGNTNMNNKTVYVNWDAIDTLPDNYEVRFTIIKFDPTKLNETFSNVGSTKKPSWYPKTELMYKIADAIGAEGLSEKKVEWITEEINVNPLILKSLIMDDATMRKIVVGARVTKQSKILREDGTFRISPPETNEYNFYDRACLEFLAEEERTNNYKKHEKWDNGNEKAFFYDTPKKREKRYLELKKFAIQQAETKSFCKTIRVLAGLPTGFQTKDLQSGELVFSKYVKSKRLMKLETAARIDAIRQGKVKELENISEDLFGTDQIETSNMDNDSQENEMQQKNPFADFDLDKQEPNEKTKIKNVIEQYYNNHITELEKIEGAKDCIEKTIINYELISIKYLKEVLYKLENNIPGIEKINHDIDLGKDVF
jgi:hypothetical protein